MEWSDFAVVLLIVACTAVGVTSAVLRTWAFAARIYSLEHRVAIVEGITTREVKIRAGQERWKKPEKDEELAKMLLNAQQQHPVQRKLNWWETNLPRSATK